jgi:hypothetical protein
VKNAPTAASAAIARRWKRLATKVPVLVFATPPGAAANPLRNGHKKAFANFI